MGEVGAGDDGREGGPSFLGERGGAAVGNFPLLPCFSGLGGGSFLEGLAETEEKGTLATSERAVKGN